VGVRDVRRGVVNIGVSLCCPGILYFLWTVKERQEENITGQVSEQSLTRGLILWFMPTTANLWRTLR